MSPFVGIVLGLSLNLGMLELATSIPDDLSTTTTNYGLLGNINGDMNDDLITPSGTLLPSNSTEREIYYHYGELCKTSIFQLYM